MRFVLIFYFFHHLSVLFILFGWSNAVCVYFHLFIPFIYCSILINETSLSLLKGDNNSLIDYDDLLDYVALQILNQFDPNLEGGKMCLRETLNDDDNEAYKQEQGEEVDWESMEKLSEDWDCTTRDADASGLPLCRSSQLPISYIILS